MLVSATAILLAACSSSHVRDSLPSDRVQSDNLSPEEVHRRCYGYIYGEEGLPLDYAEAYKWCQRAAEIPGNASAVTLLAELHFNGQGTSVNLTEAARLYRTAADNGHSHAQYMIGMIYILGRGVTTDEAEGIRWLELATQQGHEQARDMLEQAKKLQK
jgi:TPR repeat protein